VDVARGVVVKSPNLPLVETPVAPPLAEALDRPVVLENDAKAAVWGESVAGAAVGFEQAVMLTLGTGVGGGLLLDGRVYRGAHGAAGELGHLVVQPGGLPCGCGGQGCLEMYASGRALARYAAERAGDPRWDPEGKLSALDSTDELIGSAVSRLAKQGYPGALQAVRELAGWLGIALVSVTNAFDPQVIVVGGGVSELGDMLLGPAVEYLRKHAIAPGRDNVRVVTAQLGNEAGLVGAGLAAWQAFDRAGV
jgi:glucokinase